MNDSKKTSCLVSNEMCTFFRQADYELQSSLDFELNGTIFKNKSSNFLNYS